MASTDAIRVFAADVGLNPSVNGATNVQDALDASGGLALAANDDTAEADATTTIPFAGGEVAVQCIKATPPAWMNNAGAIIEPGLYQAVLAMQPGAAPTTPGLYVLVVFGFSSTAVPADAMAIGNINTAGEVFSLTDADLPLTLTCDVVPQTDVSATTIVQLAITRLAIAS